MVTTPPSTPCDNVSRDQPSAAMTTLNVVDGEIVMMDGEAPQQPPGWDVSPRSSGKRPSSCMEEEIHQYHPHDHHHHHHHNEGTSSPRTDSLQQQVSEQGNPMHGPRVRLTESGTWAQSWRSGHDSQTHGGEYYHNIGGMVATFEHSSPGFNRHSSNSSSMNLNVSGDGTRRLMQVAGGEPMVEPSSARFQTPSPNLQQTMIPVSSHHRSNFGAAMNVVSPNLLLSRSAPADTSVLCFSKGLSSNSSEGTSNSGEEMRRRHRPKRYAATLFDQELEGYESQIARTASENVMRQLNTRLARSLSCPEDTFLLQVGPGGAAKAKLERAISEAPHNLSLTALHSHQFPSPSSSGTIKIGGAEGMKSVPKMKLGSFMTLLNSGSHDRSGYGNPSPALQEEPKLQSTDSPIDDKVCSFILFYFIHATAVDPPNWPSLVTHSPTSSNTLLKLLHNLLGMILRNREGGVNRSNGLVWLYMLSVFGGYGSLIDRSTNLCPQITAGCLKGICTWIEPLRFLLRKGLSVSDVGELGRVVLPKARLFQHDSLIC